MKEIEMEFWEVVKAYQESGMLSRIEGDDVWQDPKGFMGRYGKQVYTFKYELEPQKIEVTREMLEKAWDDNFSNCAWASKDNIYFKAFAESLGFK